MTLDALTPDVALSEMLDSKVEVQTSATKKHAIRCYADGKQPNKGLGDEFLSVLWNGAAVALAQPTGLFRGNIALTVYCKTQGDGTVKTQRVRQILGQCHTLTDGKMSDGFFFRLDPTQVITPTTPNLTTGYSTTVINVEWRETSIS